MNILLKSYGLLASCLIIAFTMNAAENGKFGQTEMKQREQEAMDAQIALVLQPVTLESQSAVVAAGQPHVAKRKVQYMVLTESRENYYCGTGRGSANEKGNVWNLVYELPERNFKFVLQENHGEIAAYDDLFEGARSNDSNLLSKALCVISEKSYDINIRRDNGGLDPEKPDYEPKFHGNRYYGECVGDTALHIAMRKGNVEAVELLLQHKADSQACNNQYDQPLYSAQEALRKKNEDEIAHITSGSYEYWQKINPKLDSFTLKQMIKLDSDYYWREKSRSIQEQDEIATAKTLVQAKLLPELRGSSGSKLPNRIQELVIDYLQ